VGLRAITEPRWGKRREASFLQRRNDERLVISLSPRRLMNYLVRDHDQLELGKRYKKATAAASLA
jgi:hypothetical protein